MKCLQRFAGVAFCLAICLCAQAQVGLTPATVGADYHVVLSFDTQVKLPIHLDLTGKLPDGLALNQDFTITGKPTKPGPSSFAVSLSDAGGVVASKVFTLQVNAATDASGKKEEASAAPAGSCPGANPVRPRVTSRLTEGVTKITGMAEPTTTGCSTKIRAWLVPDPYAGILTNEGTVTQIAVTGEDPVVSAQGTWSMDLAQPLDSGQQIQIEQYFETQKSDSAGNQQTTSTTIFGFVSNQMSPKVGDRRIIQKIKHAQNNTGKKANKGNKNASNMSDKSGQNGMAHPETDESAKWVNETQCGAAMIHWSDARDRQKEVCDNLMQASVKFLSVPQETQGVADWGRVRATFISGALIAHDQGSFSNASMFLGFSLDKSWRMPDSFVSNSSGGFGLGVNTFFDVRLTSVPVASCQNAATGGGSGTAANCDQTLDTFLTSRKTARFSTGVYFPMVTTTWQYQGAKNALYLAPLIKLGFDTPVESFDSKATAQTQGATSSFGPRATTGTDTASPINNGRFYNNYSFGIRLGHYQLSSSRNQAPMDISHLDVTMGRFSNLESLVNVPGSTEPGHQRLWRFQLEGLLKIPNTPAVIGFSANVGQQVFGADRLSKPAPDDLRFLFGTKFDVGKLVAKLKGPQ